MSLWGAAWWTCIQSGGSIEDAGNVFKKMSSRDVVSWTVMILGHMQCREGQKAFELFQEML